jgi:biotin carboxyl carrier protein
MRFVNGLDGEGRIMEHRGSYSKKVIKFYVAEGDKVRKNQTLAVVEAMKMENELKSPGDGTVKKIHTSAGDLVDTNKPLLEIEAG